MEDTFNISAAINKLKNMALVEKKVPSVEEIEKGLADLKEQRKTIENKIGDLTNKINGDYLVEEKDRLEDQQRRLDIKKNIDEYNGYRKKYEEEIKGLDKEIEDLEIVIKEVNESLNNYRNPSYANQFELIIQELEEKLKNYESKLEQYKSQKKSVYDLLNKTIENIQENEKIKQQLEEQIPKAANYINQDKKKDLEEELAKAQKQLQDVENEIKKLENHPVYVAHLAEIAYSSGGMDLTYRYLEQLASIANTIPNMNTPQSNIESLDQLESESISARNKAYKTKKTTDSVVKLLENRLKKLDIPEDDSFEKQISSYKAELISKGTAILDEIKTVQEEINRLENELEYRQRKIKDDSLLNSEIEQYNLDMPNIIDRLSALKGLLASLFNEHKLLDNEIENISTFEILRSNTHTQLTAEKASLTEQLDTLKGKKVEYLVAKSEIQKQAETLMEGVIGIKHRKEFDCSPDELLASIKDALDKSQNVTKTPKEEEEKVVAEVEEPQVEPTLEAPVEEPENIPVVDLDALAEERTTAADLEEPMEGPLFDEPEVEPEIIDQPIDVPSFNPGDAGLDQTAPIMPIDTQIPDEIYRVVGIEPVHVKDANVSKEPEIPADFTAITGGKSDLDDLGLNAADGDDLTGLLNGSFLDQTVGTPIIKR